MSASGPSGPLVLVVLIAVEISCSRAELRMKKFYNLRSRALMKKN